VNRSSRYKSGAVVAARYIAMLPALFHLLVFLHHAYVSFHLLTQIDFTKSDDDYVHNVLKKFKWRYFTCWNFVSSIHLGLCNDPFSSALSGSVFLNYELGKGLELFFSDSFECIIHIF
jgi:hypothetical protein